MKHRTCLCYFAQAIELLRSAGPGRSELWQRQWEGCPVAGSCLRGRAPMRRYPEQRKPKKQVGPTPAPNHGIFLPAAGGRRWYLLSSLQRGQTPPHARSHPGMQMGLSRPRRFPCRSQVTRPLRRQLPQGQPALGVRSASGTGRGSARQSPGCHALAAQPPLFGDRAAAGCRERAATGHPGREA